MGNQAKKNKEITMEKLAVMVNNGFESMNEKMEKMEKRLEKKIESAKNELKAEINKKVDVFTHKGLEFRVEKIEEKIEILRGK